MSFTRFLLRCGSQRTGFHQPPQRGCAFVACLFEQAPQQGYIGARRQQRGGRYRKKTGFLSLTEAYHGDTLGSVSGIAAPLGYGLAGDLFGVQTAIAVMGIAVLLTLPLCAVLRPTISAEPVRI